MPIISGNKLSNQKVVNHLNEIEKRNVVEHNDLITSVAKMDKTPLKIFELAVSCIDTDNPPKDNLVYLSKTELFSFFEVTDSNKHTRFREAIKKMQEQAFFEIKEIKDEGFEMISIVPIPTVKWNSYNDDVMIRFNPDIMPYLIDLKKNFTQYALSDVMELNSKYSIILYKWLSMQYNQYDHYSNKGGRRAEQVENYRNPIIKVIKLRTLTNTVDEYKETYHFFRYVVENSLKEINQHTNFTVTYDKIKKGRSIDSIVFHITKKPVDDDTSYKDDDPVTITSKAQKTHTEAELSQQAIVSPYTKILIAKFLLSAYEMTDISIMAGLQEHVYPLYDELKELRGVNGVKEHISYVHSKAVDYSKKNIVKYLKRAIEQYLARVKRQEF